MVIPMKGLLLMLLATGLSHAAPERLRISVVVEPDSPDAQPMTYRTAKEEQQVWVSNQPVVTDKQVKSASLAPTQEKTVAIALTAEGTNAMIAATTPMRPGVDRLAIIIDGKLHSAPVIRSVPLGRDFIIEGLHDLDDRQLANLIRGIMGQAPLGPDEAVPAPPPAALRPPAPKQVPYSEEELQALKQARERLGFHQLDRLPDEAELDRTLREGMSADEVIALFGKPSGHNRKPDAKEFHLTYQIAPERRPERPDGKMSPESFVVRFRDDKVVSWGIYQWSGASREMKTEGRKPGLLKAIFPEIDVSADDVNYVAWTEGIRIPDLDQPIAQVDLASLLGLLMTAAATVEADQAATTRADCDVLKLLAKHLPEITKLTAAAKAGKLPLADVRATIKPWMYGEKPFPSPLAPAPTPAPAP